ncbi:hypothetical protein ZIOFF_013596 [Zingiber officinale]|uniref:Uncharacterized protein n=1 Tax=Zingiber officinale TaxID=94328 RepID=A0A8J5HMB7_ZINOF|nr:hypothetical protein ZIOFF_013596 [Zingiber officinale]
MESQGETPKGRRIMVTFDIDGTLIRSTGSSSNHLHRQAFAHAFLQVFGLQDATIDVVQHHGQTDPLILVNAAIHYGVPPDVARERLPEMKLKMIEYAKEHTGEVGEGLEVLPGVTSLLDNLSSNNVTIGLWCVASVVGVIISGGLGGDADGTRGVLDVLLAGRHKCAFVQEDLKVTGNLEEIAWIKMDGLGIRKYFTIPNFGGFGSDHTDRGELVKIATERGQKISTELFELRVHVGDTPNDIKAAEYGGALAVGVCTGIFTEAELKQASSGTAIILPDLTDSKAFMKLLGI